MLYEFIYSLRVYLSEEIPELKKVQMMYDGLEIIKLEKPFVTIMDFKNPSELMSAGSRSYEETYMFQVGVFAETYEQRLKLQRKVRDALRRKIPFYDETLTKTDLTFYCDVSDFTPIENNDLANETFNHRGYYDVNIVIYRNKDEQYFTQ